MCIYCGLLTASELKITDEEALPAIPTITEMRISKIGRTTTEYQTAKFRVAPRAGFEPATNRLTAGCSTAELPGNAGKKRQRPRITKAPAHEKHQIRIRNAPKKGHLDARQRYKLASLEATPGIEPGYTVLQTVA